MPSENADLSAFTTDFRRLQNQKAKAGGGVEARVLTNLAFEAGEQGVTYASRTLTMRRQNANKLALVFNLMSQRGRKLIGRLCSIAPTFKARPQVAPGVSPCRNRRSCVEPWTASQESGVYVR